MIITYCVSSDCLGGLLALAHPRRLSKVLAGINGVAGAELLFNAQQLVVLGKALGSARGTRLDLTGAQTNGEIGNVRVFRLARSVARHDAPTGFLGLDHGGDGFRDRSDLVHLEQQTGASSFVNGAANLFNVRHGQVVTDHLECSAVLGREPVVERKYKTMNGGEITC